MIDVATVADKADVIVSGFAVINSDDSIKVFNLNTANGVAVFSDDGTLIETNMDDIELGIAKKVLAEARTYGDE